jgi:hypothetical protein
VPAVAQVAACVATARPTDRIADRGGVRRDRVPLCAAMGFVVAALLVAAAIGVADVIDRMTNRPLQLELAESSRSSKVWSGRSRTSRPPAVMPAILEVGAVELEHLGRFRTATRVPLRVGTAH